MSADAEGAALKEMVRRGVMKTLFVASVLLPLAAPAGGQQWTEEERGLVHHIQSCWDAWMETHRGSGDIQDFYVSCPSADDVSMWWTDWSTPQSKEQTGREFPYFGELDLGWIALNPVAVRIWDDVGMVQFYGYWKAGTPACPTTTE
ncbi:MAG TPA: hypothetical protein VK858_14435 [Longimicrobiales bacterium]|nr:hypothetical protein [Longimicrobiales bacterium]